MLLNLFKFKIYKVIPFACLLMIILVNNIFPDFKNSSTYFIFFTSPLILLNLIILGAGYKAKIFSKMALIVAIFSVLIVLIIAFIHW